jgi:AcrR family transcriptional regulator
MLPAARHTREAISPEALPRGPHSLTREEVAANQRLRLILAMVDAVGEKGYVATTVADVISRAGVSRKAFYEHFTGKDDCFLASYDAVAGEGRRRVMAAYHKAEGWPDRVEAAIRSLFEAALENPDAVRLGMIEISAAGPAGVERREQAVLNFERVIQSALDLAPGTHKTLPETTLRAIVGGLHGILCQHVRRNQVDDLLDLVPDLVRWATSYYPAPPAIEAGVPFAKIGYPTPCCRTPGTLSLGFPPTARRGASHRERGVSRSFVVHNQRERILDAIANLTASRGYAGLTLEDIVREAGVSLQTFYEHFAGKEDGLLVAYEIGHLRGLSIVEHAYRSQPDWRTSVRAAIHALFDFLASEPSFAHLALMDAFIATPESAQRAEKGITAYAEMLMPGFEEVPKRNRPPAVTIEAVVSGLCEILFGHVVAERVHELPSIAPHATYLALAPFVGGDEAAQIALGADGI